LRKASGFPVSFLCKSARLCLATYWSGEPHASSIVGRPTESRRLSARAAAQPHIAHQLFKSFLSLLGESKIGAKQTAPVCQIKIRHPFQ
jgi:hypothetical protein